MQQRGQIAKSTRASLSAATSGLARNATPQPASWIIAKSRSVADRHGIFRLQPVPIKQFRQNSSLRVATKYRRADLARQLSVGAQKFVGIVLMETEPFSDPTSEIFEAAGYQYSARACAVHGSDQGFCARRQGTRSLQTFSMVSSGRPASRATLSRTASSKSMTPSIACSVMADTASPTPASAASSSDAFLLYDRRVHVGDEQPFSSIGVRKNREIKTAITKFFMRLIHVLRDPVDFKFAREAGIKPCCPVSAEEPSNVIEIDVCDDRTVRVRGDNHNLCFCHDGEGLRKS